MAYEEWIDEKFFEPFPLEDEMVDWDPKEVAKDRVDQISGYWWRRAALIVQNEANNVTVQVWWRKVRETWKESVKWYCKQFDLEYELPDPSTVFFKDQTDRLMTQLIQECPEDYFPEWLAEARMEMTRHMTIGHLVAPRFKRERNVLGNAILKKEIEPLERMIAELKKKWPEKFEDDEEED